MDKTLHRLTGLVFALLCTLTAWADGEIYYGIYQGTGTLTGYGTGKSETYDVAIHLTDPSLVGMEIRGIRIPVNASAKNASGYKAWLTHALTLESNKMAPDIVSLEATPSGSWAEVRLDAPYVIEAGGLYVGYSLTVSSVDASNANDPNKAPVMTTATENPEGLLIHTSRTYRKWVGLAEVGSPAVVVLIGGDNIREHAAILEAPDNLYTTTGKSIATTLTLVNHGTKAITDVDYEIEVGGETVSKHQNISLAGEYYGRFKTLTATIPAVDTKGTFDAKFRITKVNGVDNEDPVGVTSQPVTYLAEIPLHKPLVEEYTGLWCQYCPRALAGMEKMADKNGENFVGVAFHDGDVMQFSSYYPAAPSGLPAVFIDRVASFDPLTGQSDWEKRKAIIAPATVDVEAVWADEARTKIVATSTTSFVRDFTNSPYLLSYILIGNDLHSTSWNQSNAYSGSSSDDPYLNKVCKMPNPIKDYHYNEVALDMSQVAGGPMPESLPSEVKEYTPYQHSVTFDISANELPLDKEKLEVVVVLLHKETGEVVNSNKGHVVIADGIEKIKNEGIRMKNEIFDLAGRRITEPVKGLYIQNGKKIIK